MFLTPPQTFSSTGVSIAISYLERHTDVDLVAFLPARYLRRESRDGAEPDPVLAALVASQRLTLVPAGCDDDSFIIDYGMRVVGLTYGMP